MHPEAVHPAPTFDLCFAAASWWWAVDVLYRGLPPWSAVPPILFGVAALWNARTNARRTAPARGR
jgi:hypothetical protein